MSGFVVGQRWMSASEPELGLGMVAAVATNRVTILYLACDEQRVYAQDNAPLTRVQFLVGDEIETEEGEQGIVKGVDEREGLIYYQLLKQQNEVVTVDEMSLSHHIQFNKPQDKLFIGQAEIGRWFSLRYQTWQHLHRLHISQVKGLLGARTSLIPHQLFIAHEVAQREKVRVMLADEVGLGKTIEAGLILHHRLHMGLSERVMVIVPESLLHQWLVEMLRRFNLKFSLFDESRCVAIEEENPFLTEQLALCSLDFFAQNPHRKEQAIQAGWDIVVVDEAHHLQWTEQAVDDSYLFVEQLAANSAGLILLTATPEQLGKETHFAQLRLLDADRFYSFKKFLAEQKAFEPIACLAKKIVNQLALNEVDEKLLASLVDQKLAVDFLQNIDDAGLRGEDLIIPESMAQGFGFTGELGRQAHSRLRNCFSSASVESKDPSDSGIIEFSLLRQDAIDQLIDRHGTGRILFRNSRHVVKGFPQRELLTYPLLQQAESSEDIYLQWLVTQLKALREVQVLLICKQAETVISLQQQLRDKYALKVAAFHEGMSIFERDRAAAYFADPEAGVRILLCSEIGSEGRNFQFVRHLILLDLPENPDLLQQRIGRLDRIGQKHIIKIHVPYIVGSKQHSLCRWYGEGLKLFQANSNAASEVYRIQQQALEETCLSERQHGLDELVNAGRVLIQEIEAQMHQARDLLLELNSCRQDDAEKLIYTIEKISQPQLLWQYMEDIFECFGVDSEYHSEGCAILQAGQLQRVSQFPGVPEDGVTVTVNREVALAREDMQYLTWEHPMLVAVMDLMLSGNIGNAALSIIKHEELEAGQYLLECLFLVECSAPVHLQLSRFLPPTPVRILIDQKQQDLTAQFQHNELIDVAEKIEIEQISAFISGEHKNINAMIASAEQIAEISMQDIISQANMQMLKVLAKEIKRLEALKQVNSGIKSEEVIALKDKAIDSHGYIKDAKLRLDAVRFIISS